MKINNDNIMEIGVFDEYKKWDYCAVELRGYLAGIIDIEKKWIMKAVVTLEIWLDEQYILVEK